MDFNAAFLTLDFFRCHIFAVKHVAGAHFYRKLLVGFALIIYIVSVCIPFDGFAVLFECFITLDVFDVCKV